MPLLQSCQPFTTSTFPQLPIRTGSLLAHLRTLGPISTSTIFRGKRLSSDVEKTIEIAFFSQISSRNFYEHNRLSNLSGLACISHRILSLQRLPHLYLHIQYPARRESQPSSRVPTLPKISVHPTALSSIYDPRIKQQKHLTTSSANLYRNRVLRPSSSLLQFRISLPPTSLRQIT